MRGALVMILLAAPAYADNAPHKEGDYSGADAWRSPARDPSARPAAQSGPPPKGTLSWIGFEAKDGGAEVFFQSVAPFELSQHVEGSRLVVDLRLTRLGPNTWRQVDTRFFDNPLSAIVAKRGQRGARTRPRIARRARSRDRGPDLVQERRRCHGSYRCGPRVSPDGLYYAYLSFPEGTAGPAGAVSAAPGARATPAAAIDEPDAADAPEAPEADDEPAPAPVAKKPKR